VKPWRQEVSMLVFMIVSKQFSFGYDYLLNKHHPERAAFDWVQQYISQFGGDPSKVVL
jgi:hypothetical protein